MARSQLLRRLGLAPKRRAPSTTVLLALGAIAGLALGVVIADQSGGLERLLGMGGRDDSVGPRRKRPRLRPGRRAADMDGSHRIDMDDAEGLYDEYGGESEVAPGSLAGVSRTPMQRTRAQLERSLTTRFPAARPPLKRVGAEGSAGKPSASAPPDARGSSRTNTGSAPRAGGGGSQIGAGVGNRAQRNPFPASDVLEARVLEAFINDPILKERAVDICAAGPGAIELTGWVLAPSEIAHAVTLARGVPDVVDVVDSLQVRSASANGDMDRGDAIG